MTPRPALLYLAPWGWSFLRNRSQPLATALADRCDVFYVDPTIKRVGGPALDRWVSRFPALRAVVERPVLTLRPSSGVEGVHWVKYAGLRGSGADRAAVVRDALPALVRLARRIGRGHPRRVLLTSQPLSGALVDALPGWRVVVDLQDPWFEVSTAEEAPRAEVLALLARADVVTANGGAIASEYAELAGRSIHSLPNGLDPCFIESSVGPPPGGRPRAVFAGNLNPRTDLALLERVVRAMPGWDFVFAGRVQLFPETQAVWDAMRALPNVRFLGSRPHPEMPALYASATALLLPYAHAGSGAMFPQKLLEYVASARPIVSTLPFELPGLPPGQLLHTPDADALIAALGAVAVSGRAYDPAFAAACRAYAAEHLWERRAEEFARLVGLDA